MFGAATRSAISHGDWRIHAASASAAVAGHVVVGASAATAGRTTPVMTALP